MKSFREGRVQLRDSFARVQDGEVWLHGMHISPYAYSSGFGYADPDRLCKLLLHRRQIEELERQTHKGRFTSRPLAYFQEGASRSTRRWPKAGVTTTNGGPSAREADMEARREMAAHGGGRCGAELCSQPAFSVRTAATQGSLVRRMTLYL